MTYLMAELAAHLAAAFLIGVGIGWLLFSRKKSAEGTEVAPASPRAPSGEDLVPGPHGAPKPSLAAQKSGLSESEAAWAREAEALRERASAAEQALRRARAEAATAWRCEASSRREAEAARALQSPTQSAAGTAVSAAGEASDWWREELAAARRRNAQLEAALRELRAGKMAKAS